MQSVKKILSPLASTLFVLLFFPVNSFCQAAGCKDPLANNYSAAATANDGSCTYNAVNYTPPVKTDPISDSLIESSGLQMAGNYLWSINDRGGTATIYRIDTTSDAVLQRIILEGAQNTDWEEISYDGTYFYIGDFGNNRNGARTDLKIYKFPFDAIPDYISNPLATVAVEKIETISFIYSDQPQPPIPVAGNSTKYDCEAMIVDGGKIHLFSKNWIDNTCTHYIINSTAGGTHIAAAAEILNTQFLITGAAKTTATKTLALLGYQGTLPGRHFIYLLSGYTDGKYFNGNKRKIALPDATVMGQAEGIAFRNGMYGYISNESFKAGGIINIKQKLRSFDFTDFITPLSFTYIFTGSGNWSVPANWLNNIAPPASISEGSEIIIDPAEDGECMLDIPYTVPPGRSIIVNNKKKFLVNGNLEIQ
jgi:hypothetical protein